LLSINTLHSRIFESYRQSSANRTPAKPICHPLKRQKKNCCQVDRALRIKIAMQAVISISPYYLMPLVGKSARKGLRITCLAGSPGEDIRKETVE